MRHPLLNEEDGMTIHRILIALTCIICTAGSLSAQALLNANGPGNTFEEITDALAPGVDTSAVEDPQCVHPAFGRHIAEVWDADLTKYVFEFYMHVAIDNDRCINFDRQRVEIKTYDASPAALKGVSGETILYKWRFKVPVGFKPSSSFTHIHQIKAVGGNDADPLITLTVRKGSPNKMELIHNNTTKVAIANLSLFEGNWVECTQSIFVDSLHGSYAMTIKKVSDGTTILSYSSNDLMTIRSDNTFIRPKWGIYRSLNSPSDLRDDTLRFSDFYIGESATTVLPATPASLTAAVISSSVIRLAWTDNASNEEAFRIERSTNGTNWTTVASLEPNSTTYEDAGITSTSQFFYRVRAENTFGASPYSNVAASLPGTVLSVKTGNWSSPATWNGGSVPTSSDNVTIGGNDTVTIDIDGAVCSDLAVEGNLTFANSNSLSITVNGNAAVGSFGDWNTYQTGAPAGVFTHTVTLQKNLTVASGGIFDMRKGSGSNVAVGTVIFSGSTNSTITLNQTAYASAVEEFNAVTINKTSGAKVILAAGNLFMSNNNSTGPSVLNLTSGIIETGPNVLVHLSTASGGVVSGSATSYINGALGRGGNTSAGTNRTFEVGDANGYRPATVSTSAGIASGGYVVVRCISGNADHSSSFSGGIDKVSGLRYYSITYRQGTGATAAAGITKTALSYAEGDGVANGVTTLRVAHSTDNMSIWIGIAQTTLHTTAVSTVPVMITPDPFGSPVTLYDGQEFHIALANATGGGNTLPVELIGFSASLQTSGALLQWQTEVEVNSAGFGIERMSVTEGTSRGWSTIGFVLAGGTSHIPHEYSFVDKEFRRGVSVYRLRITDNDGTSSYSSEVTVTIGSAPKILYLSDNYPNPFNPSTAVEFSVPSDGVAAVTVYTPLGQKVAELFNGAVEAGRLYYAVFNASSLSSGVYFYELRFGGHVKVKKIMVMK